MGFVSEEAGPVVPLDNTVLFPDNTSAPLGSNSASMLKFPRFHLQAQCRLLMISASRLMASVMGESIYGCYVRHINP